jgi:hypothetical protein
MSSIPDGNSAEVVARPSVAPSPLRVGAKGGPRGQANPVTAFRDYGLPSVAERERRRQTGFAPVR